MISPEEIELKHLREEFDPIAGDEYVQIPPAKYITQIIRWSYRTYPQFKSSKDRGRRIVFIHRVIDGPYQGTELEQYYVRYDIFSNDTAYYQSYLLLTDGHPPKKRDRIPPKIFLNAICEVLVGYTAKRFKTGEVKPAYLQYSEVKEVIKVLQRDKGGML